ncbi:hypothetical protein BDK51DRAFT_32516 [Blyttiomyces helicus]|uniref:Uncharacterized protein n=1 Tax=Blyttiomyces helicus TaxID=388810 RepID=A0A4P9W3Y9_9FUNG|nr:hypothetical protein BDK51DRAFT_32516 [Blyttiomyces helicus]|eukprot:RKO87051.1 hypothetical protein BDK51DRAFT_32516 [Blyttiomyces helicus]
MSLPLFDKPVILQTYLNTTDLQGTDGAILAGGGTVNEARPLNKWSRAYVRAYPVPRLPPTCPKGILDFDSDDKIQDFDSDDELSDLEEEEKYEAVEEPPQLENNSAPATVYDGGVRDEEVVAT